MKKVFIGIFALIMCTTLFAQNENQINKNTKLLVYYFHITNRCHTCISIEATTKKVLEETYQKKLDDGTIIFKTFNVDLPENKDIVKKYEAYGATLALTKIENGKEVGTEDITSMAFSKINNEDLFKSELKSKIDDQLK
jgi:hypothetical protein